MKIFEQHKNGSRIEVSGWSRNRVLSAISAWRSHQDRVPEDPKPEPPKNGASANVSGPMGRSYDQRGVALTVPVPLAQIGFQIEERHVQAQEVHD